MATAKKPAAKKVAAKKPAVSKDKLDQTAKKINELHAKRVKATKSSMALSSRASRLRNEVQQKFSMPREVAEWIERANSTINHLKGKIEKLEQENKDLKAYRKFAERRILNVSAE